MALTKQGMDAVRSQSDLARSLDTTFDSITALQLAAGDVGLDGLEGSLTRLNRRLGAAEVGSGAAANAVKALRLDLQALSRMDVDERVATIADAIRDSGVSMQRAARFAQDLGFEQRQAAEFFTQGGDAIRAYRERVEALGLSLSDIDAQKVVDAQNAMGIFGDLTRGASQILAAELSPIIQQVAIELENAAIEAGGMGNAVQEAVQTGVKALAFMADAADGVKRVFQLAADGIIIILSGIAYAAAEAAIGALRILDAMPGVDMSKSLASVRGFSSTAKGVIEEAAANMQATLDEPFAGEKLLAFYEKAQKAGQEAAESAVAAAEANRKSGDAFTKTSSAGTKAIKNQRDAIGDLIKSLELESATVGMSRKEQVLYKAALDGANASQLAQVSALLSTIDAHEEADKAAKAYADTVRSLRTDEEMRTDTLREQLEIIRSAANVSQADKDKAESRAVQSAIGSDDKPRFSGADGAMGELFRFDEQEKDLNKWYEKRLEMLDEFRELFAEKELEWDEAELEAKQYHIEQLQAIDDARRDVLLASTEDMFSNAAALTKQFAGENSKAYKAMFIAEKSAGAARAAVAVATGIAQAAANPWPLNIAAIASTIAATAGLVANVNAIGMAHDGIDSVPKTGTWILEKGERVITSKTSAKLDGMLDGAARGGLGRRGNSVNQIINVTGTVDSYTASQLARQAAQRQAIAEARLG
ncbi:MAG TPA: hypothetical protein GX732_01010 [Pseudomonas sp.]|nr:hypothetical protein [Pseudomonas sp.]